MQGQNLANQQAEETKADSTGLIYLVSCVAKKRLTPSVAKDLYISDWFKKAREYVEMKNYPWFILSAEYGLVSPDQTIVPYEKTLNTMRVGERRNWAEKVIAQIDETMPEISHVVLLGGERYREFLVDHLKKRKVTVDVPMKGLRIGEQLSWLGQQVSSQRNEGVA